MLLFDLLSAGSRAQFAFAIPRTMCKVTNEPVTHSSGRVKREGKEKALD